METLTFPTAAESQAADTEQEAEIVPSTVVVNRIDCYVVPDQGTYKTEWCYKSMPKTTPESIRVSLQANFNAFCICAAG